MTSPEPQLSQDVPSEPDAYAGWHGVGHAGAGQGAGGQQRLAQGRVGIGAGRQGPPQNRPASTELIARPKTIVAAKVIRKSLFI